MASTLLSSEWKKVLKDHKDAPDTAPLTKALDAYAKAESKVKDAPQPVLDALEEVVDAAKSARSANVKDKKRKPVVDFLDDVLKDAASMKVKTERLLQEKDERDRTGEDDDEGGDDERAKLTERLNKVKKLPADSARPFVLALGKKSHGLVIAKTAALSSTHKKRARAMRDGSGKVFFGLVFGEGGRYVFQMEEKPPGGLAKAIKKAAATHTDLPTIRVLLRGPEGFELDDEADVEEVADLGPDTEDQETAETERNGDATRPTTTANPEAVAYQQRVDALTPALKDGLKQGGELKQALTLLYSQAQLAARKNDYATATRLLDDLKRRIDEGTTTTTEPTGGESIPQGMDAFKLRLKALKDRYDRIKDLPAGAVLKAPMLEAVKAVAAGKAEPATEALDTLEARLTTAERSAAVSSEIGANDGDLVAYRSALLNWQKCRTRVRDSVETLIKDVLADPETQELETEERQEVEDGIPSLRQEIADFDNRLDDAVNGYLNAPTSNKRKAMQGIRKAINAYRAALSNPSLLAMADSGFGSYPVVSEIEDVLKEFEALLVR